MEVTQNLEEVTQNNCPVRTRLQEATSRFAASGSAHDFHAQRAARQGLVPAIDAVIAWSEPASQNTWIGSFDEWNTLGREQDRYTFTSGAVYRRWLCDPRLTPEAVFYEIVAHYTNMPSTFACLLRQFAKIEECQWARDMLAGANAR